jgi:hypothetical protein
MKIRSFPTHQAMEVKLKADHLLGSGITHIVEMENSGHPQLQV